MDGLLAGSLDSGATASPWPAPLEVGPVAFVTTPVGVSGAFRPLPFQVRVEGLAGPSVSATHPLCTPGAIPAGVCRYHREGRVPWRSGTGPSGTRPEPDRVRAWRAGRTIRVCDSEDTMVLRTLARLLALAFVLLGPPAWAAEGPGDEAFWYGTAADGTPRVRLHFFWSASCPHCGVARPFAEALPARLPWLELHSHEVSRSREAVNLYIEAARVAGGEARSVPGFVFCRQMEVGFHDAETSGAQLVRRLESCHAARAGAAPLPVAEAALAGALHEPARPGHGPGERGSEGGQASLPVLGLVDLQGWSLPTLTVVLAGLDAFNPCAFFVLLFLLSLLVHAKSRARMLFIGGVFVLFSGLVYFAFMAAWLNVFLLMGEIRGVTLVAGLLAVFIAAVNIKDFFWFQQGLTLSIPESAKPGLFKRMRGVATAGSIAPMALGTVLLAIVANSYELLCTAGFPMVFTRALTLQDLDGASYYGYLALYNVIYVVPLALIVLAFTYTLGSRKLTEREGRLLKLVSGYMMLGLGLLLVLAPGLLTSAGSALGVLVIALAATAVTARLAPEPAVPAREPRP
jgi:hypothetical protein